MKVIYKKIIETMGNKLLLVLLSALIMVSCSTTSYIGGPSSVAPASQVLSLSEGSVVYGLPRTVFTVRVKMERTVEIPGPYADYAADLLGLTNAIKSDREYWSIVGVTVNSHEEIDPSELYVLETNGAMSTNVLSLKDEGLVLDLNPESNTSTKGMSMDTEIDANRFMSYDLGSDEYYITQVDTAYRKINIDSTFINVPYVVEKKKQLSVAQLAEKAAKRLIDIREGKIMILTGEAEVFPQSDAAIKELTQLEEDYTELFIGKRFTETRYYTYSFIPDKDMSGKPETLFNFSELTGISEGKTTTGSPVQISLVPEKKLQDVTILNRNSSSSASANNVYYRIPDVVNVKVLLDGDQLYSSRKLIYQFGEMVQLPSNYIIGK